MENNLTICQVCKTNPATYGDGLTWSRCSKCQREHLASQDPTPEPEAPEAPGQSFEHQIVPGLVSIIIPIYMANYTLFHYTGNCIGSVREHTKEGAYEIVIVDNGSPIQPPDLKSYYAHRVVKNDQNLGVTKAWNQGIRTSVGEYVVLLNNDVQVFDNWLEDLKATLDFGGFDLVMAHPMYSLTEPFARAVESKKIREEVLKKAENNKSLLTSDFKDFSCVMFKKSLLDEIGLFDETFFNYCSDSDMFRRLEKAGKTWCCVESVPTSHISDATGFAMEKTPEIMNEDKAKFEEKWSKSPEVEGLGQGSSASDELDQNRHTFRVQGGGDPIYLKVGTTYHKIADPDTLRALGFDFGQELTLENFDGLEKGEEINMQNHQNYA